MIHEPSNLPVNDKHCVSNIAGTALPIVDTSSKNVTTSPVTDNNYGNFNGIDAYLSVPDSADWDFGTGDFTVEFWLYLPTVLSTHSSIVSQWKAAGGADRAWELAITADNYIQMNIKDTAGTSIGLIADTISFPTGEWCHIAGVRNGTTFELFKNGVSVNTDTDSGSVSTSTIPVLMGARTTATTPDQFLNGKMSELRISKGIARYTANFTPSTTQFTSDANTKLLLHFEGATGSTTFTDDGNTGHTVTPTNAYLGGGHGISNNGVAMYTTPHLSQDSMDFNGTSDYLSIPDSPDWDGDTGYMAISAWIRLDDLGTTKVIAGKWNTDGDQKSWLLFIDTSNKILFKSSNDGLEPATAATSTTTLSISTWYHVNISFNNLTGDCEFFINGISDSITNGLEYPLYNSTSKLMIGIFEATLAIPFNGQIQGVQIHNRAIYTRNFTSPARLF